METVIEILSGFPHPENRHPHFPTVNNDRSTTVVLGYIHKVPSFPGTHPWSPAEVPGGSSDRARYETPWNPHWSLRARRPITALWEALTGVPVNWCNECIHCLATIDVIHVGQYIDLGPRLGEGVVDKVWRCEKGSVVFRVVGRDVYTPYRVAFVAVDRPLTQLGIFDKIRYDLTNWWLKSHLGPRDGEIVPEWV